MGSEAWAGTAIVASIAFACAFYYTAVAWFEHRERMAKIQRGIMDPQRPGEASPRSSDAIRDVERRQGP